MDEFDRHHDWLMRRESNSTLRSSVASAEASGTRSVGRFVAQASLVAPVVAIAWWFGGVQAAQQWWLFAGILVASVLFLVSAFSRRRISAQLPLPLIPLGLALLLGSAQLVPLPAQFLAWVAPQNHTLWQTLVPGDSVPPATADDSVVRVQADEQRFARELGVAPGLASRQLSLYPASTRHDLALLVAAVATFFLASQFFGRSSSMLGLLAVVATQGAFLAFFGLAQQLRWNGLLFGTVELTEGGAPFASFVNRNSGAGYLNMCFAAAVALTVWAFSRRRREAAAPAARPRRSGALAGRGPETTWYSAEDRPGFAGFLAEIDGFKLAASTSAVLIFAGIVCSLSRGAWISAAGAVAITLLTIAFTHRSWVRVSWLAIVAIAGLALVTWLGRLDLVEQRFASLWKQGGPPDSRLAHWENGLGAAAEFANTGSGLGTYRFVYKLYEQNGSQSWFYHAENQYLEALVEGGIPGLAFMVATIVLVLLACRRLIRQPTYSPSFACGVGGLFAVSSQVIHAGFDFGLYMPANMALLALLSGGLCGVAGRTLRGEAAMTPPHSRGRLAWRQLDWSLISLPRSRALLAGVGILLAGLIVPAGVEIFETAKAENALRSSRLEYAPDAISGPELDRLIDLVTSAAIIQPDNAELSQRLGQLWIYRYRLQALAELRQHPQGFDPAALWGWTSTINLHQKANQFQKGEQHKLKQLRQARDVRTNLTNAARALLTARSACPLLVKPHLLLAEIGTVVSELAEDQPSLERAQSLSRGDFDSLLECGLLESQADRVDRAWMVWRRAIEVLPDRADRVLSLARKHSPEHDLAELVPDRPELILQLAQEQFGDPTQGEIRRRLADRANRLLELAELPDEGQHAYLRGIALGLLGEHQSAMEWHTKALRKQPAIAEWRYQLARQFDFLGKLEEAIQQAALCVRLEPTNDTYIAYHQELAERRSAARTRRDRHNRSTENETSSNVAKPTAYHLVDFPVPSRLEK